MPIQNKLNEVMIEGKTTENLFSELAQQREESTTTLKTDLLKQSENFKQRLAQRKLQTRNRLGSVKSMGPTDFRSKLSL